MIPLQALWQWRRLVFAGVALGAVGWWIAGTKEPALPAAPAAPAARAEAPFVSVAPPLVNVSAPARTALVPMAPSPVCPGQRMALARAGLPPEWPCAGPTRTQRNGEMWVHEVAASGLPGWALRIEAVGRSVRRLTLTNAHGERYGCVADDGGCPGVRFGGGGTEPVQTIALDDALLRPLAPQRPKGMRAVDFTPSMPAAADSIAVPVRVSAELSIQANGAAEPRCSGPALTLASSRGTVMPFCAEAGHEQGGLPGGGELIGFIAYEGPTLRIQLDERQRIRRVEFGPLTCEGDACIGAALDAAPPGDPQGTRIVSFAGTTLMRSGIGGAAESVVVNGALPTP